MPAANNYLKNAIPALYHRGFLHISAFTFIEAAKVWQPSVTLQEAARAFQIRYNIDEGEYSLSAIVQNYMRMQQELIDAERQKNKQKQREAKFSQQ